MLLEKSISFQRSIWWLVAALFLLLPQDIALAQTDPAEIEFWQSVKESTVPAELEAYLEAYPEGKFVPLARLRLKRLKTETSGSAKPETAPEPQPTEMAKASSGSKRDQYAALDLFGDVLDSIRKDHREEINDAKLIRSAIAEALRTYPAPGAERASKGPGSDKCTSQSKGAIYKCLDLFGQVFEEQLKLYPNVPRKIVLSAIDGMLASMEAQLGGRSGRESAAHIRRAFLKSEDGELSRKEPPARSVEEKKRKTHISAESYLEKAERLAENSDSSDLLKKAVPFLQAVRSFKDGNHETAIRQFSSRKGTIGKLIARVSIAWTRLAENKTDLALNELEKMKKADWSRFYQRYHKGLIADVAGRKNTARTALSAAFKSRPRTLRIAEAYARHAGNAGDMKLAKKILTQHIGKSEGHPNARALLDQIEAGQKPTLLVRDPVEGLSEVYFGIGDALTGDDRKIEMGLFHLLISLYLNPDFPLAQAAVGEAHKKLKQFAEVIEAFDNVPESSPIWSSVQIRKAYALNSLEKVDEAKKLLENLAEQTPESPKAYDALGSILRSRKRYSEAEEYYSRAISKVKAPQQRHWRLYYARGVCREQQKNWKEAEADFKMALKLDPNQPLILNYLGYSWIEQGLNITEAMKLIRKAVKLKPDDGYMVDSLGWAYYRLGNYEEAVEHLKRANELRPKDPVISDHLGDAFWRVNQHEEAKRKWKAALDLDPPKALETALMSKLEDGLQGDPAKDVLEALDDLGDLRTLE